ncbi:hypothetical protein F2Q68_00016121 [Brassica cretica]|uniref:BED-type domain-containing protein n=1 Tax=Brassica cretica TaxID=69181 RepID=A0A8S9HNK2_BRACR|nr:hypothetical protein F2Q68_00016121 [Brassica cretica]
MDNPPTDSPLPRKRTSNVVGWDYGVLFDAQFPYKVKCKLCRKEFSIGVCKMKEHIGHLKGNVADCPMSTKEDQEKCKKAIAEAKNKKSPIDQLASAINPEVSMAAKKRQHNLYDPISKEKTHAVHHYCAR